MYRTITAQQLINTNRLKASNGNHRIKYGVLIIQLYAPSSIQFYRLSLAHTVHFYIQYKAHQYRSTPMTMTRHKEVPCHSLRSPLSTYSARLLRAVSSLLD